MLYRYTVLGIAVMTPTRKIIHVDCDCFFAAVERLDNPALNGLPIAVGGTGLRSVIATASYEAREFGVRSAMSTWKAHRLCPNLTLLPPRFDRYRALSQQVFNILKRYSNLIEPVSVDEGYLDVSGCDSATEIAQSIRADVQSELGITVSAGVAPNKFLAKVASDWRKPNGITVIAPQRVEQFMAQLPVNKIPGVGQATAMKLQLAGITHCQQLQQINKEILLQRFGRFGERLYHYSRGQDDRTVKTHRIRKSLSVERTFATDLPGFDHCQQPLQRLVDELEHRIEKKQVSHRIGKLVAKVRFSDFRQTTIECTSSALDRNRLFELAYQAWQRQCRPIRLLGLGVRFNEGSNDQQLLLL